MAILVTSAYLVRVARIRDYVLKEVDIFLRTTTMAHMETGTLTPLSHPDATVSFLDAGNDGFANMKSGGAIDASVLAHVVA